MNNSFGRRLVKSNEMDGNLHFITIKMYVNVKVLKIYKVCLTAIERGRVSDSYKDIDYIKVYWNWIFK